MLTGILMAAGTGTRLGHGTTKGLVEVAGRPMCYYAIDFLRAIGADKIIVIGGCDFLNLKNKIQEYDGSVEVVENKEYTKGNLYSFIKALPYIEGSFLVANTDHIYKRAIANKVRDQLSGLTAFCDFDRDLGNDDMKVWHDDMKLKKISKTLDEYNGGYVGLTYCDASVLDSYKNKINEMLKTGEDKLVVENILKELSAEGYDINIGDISGHGWLEIDFPEELKIAENELMQNRAEYF